MIIALLIWLGSLLGNGAATPFGQATTQVQERIGSVVQDAGRRAAALAVIDRILEREERLGDGLEEDLRHFVAMAADHRHDAAMLEARIQPIAVTIRSTRDDLLDLRFALRDQLTAAEWAQVFPADPAGDRR
jgi:hypothetical protein